jgi:hypothetical protein
MREPIGGTEINYSWLAGVEYATVNNRLASGTSLMR